MAEKIRWGILSTGNIATQFATALQGERDAQIVAVGSRSQDSADAFGDKFNIPNRHASYESLANDPEVDVIYIGTPHPMHNDNSLLCINAGKAVICEKPFTLNATEAKTIIDAARAKNVFLMEAMWTRFTPAMVKIRALLQDGVIGEPRLLRADFGFRAPYDPKNRLFNPALGGGALLDVGIYTVSLAWMLFGKPTEMHSTAHLGETGVDEQTAMILRYDNGALASLTCATRTDTHTDAMIFGTDGVIRIPHPWWQPQTFIVEHADANKTSTESFEMVFDANGYEYQAREVMRCLREGNKESSIMPLDETLAIMTTLDGLRAEWGLVYPGEAT